MWDTVFSYVERLLMCLSPIICAWMAWRASVSQKKTKEFLELQTKYNQKVEEDKQKEVDAQKAAIAELDKKIEKLTRQTSELAKKSDESKISEQLDNILKISRMQFEYSTSMSQVICAIGDCVEAAGAGDISTMKKELARHKKYELTMSTELLKLVE